MFDVVPGFWEQVRKIKNNYRPAKKDPDFIRIHNTAGNALILYKSKHAKSKKK
jgi:hypothetical protein